MWFTLLCLSSYFPSLYYILDCPLQAYNHAENHINITIPVYNNCILEILVHMYMYRIPAIMKFFEKYKVIFRNNHLYYSDTISDDHF